MKNRFIKRISEWALRRMNIHKGVCKRQLEAAVTGSYSRSERLQFSQSQTPRLNKLTCLYFSAQQEPRSLQSHDPQEAENMLGTLTLAKHCILAGS